MDEYEYIFCVGIRNVIELPYLPLNVFTPKHIHSAEQFTSRKQDFVWYNYKVFVRKMAVCAVYVTHVDGIVCREIKQ